MKVVNRIISIILLLNLCVLCVKLDVNASVYETVTYHTSDKLYTVSGVTKGAKHMTKDTKGGTQYQIVKISKNKIILRPQKGYDYDSSVDPYFKKKTITCSLSSNCKFYYRNASFPWTKKGVGKYKRIKKSDVLEYMNDEYIGEIRDCYFEDEKAYYYVGGYCGEIYIKNGKVVAVLTDDGD